MRAYCAHLFNLIVLLTQHIEFSVLLKNINPTIKAKNSENLGWEFWLLLLHIPKPREGRESRMPAFGWKKKK